MIDQNTSLLVEAIYTFMVIQTLLITFIAGVIVGFIAMGILTTLDK